MTLFIEHSFNLGFILSGGFAEIRYTWSLSFQKQLHTEIKYKTHTRSPAIGQADIVANFGTKRPRYK